MQFAPSRPSGQATKLSRSSNRRLVYAEPPATPNFILRKRYFDIMERINEAIMANTYTQRVDRGESAETVLEKYIVDAMERNGNIKRHDTMEKGTFQRFIVETWVSKHETDTNTIYKYHSSSSSLGKKDNHCCISINLLVNSVQRWFKCNGKDHDMNLADPTIQRECRQATESCEAKYFCGCQKREGYNDA